MTNNHRATTEVLAQLFSAIAFFVAKHCLAFSERVSAGRYSGILGVRVAHCSYGENRWQEADLYATDQDDPLAIHRFTELDAAATTYNGTVEIDRLLQTMTHIAVAFRANGLSEC